MKRLHAASGMVAFLVGCTTDKVCTQTGCVIEPLLVVVDQGTSEGKLRGGSYEFRLEVPYGEVEWTCTLPVNYAGSRACDHQGGLEAEVDGEDVVLNVRAELGGEGLALEIFEFRQGGRILGGPASFSLTVVRDGNLQAEESYAPTYAGGWVNGDEGDECGMFCGGSTEVFTLEIPE